MGGGFDEGVLFLFRGALCSFEEDILIRRNILYIFSLFS